MSAIRQTRRKFLGMGICIATGILLFVFLTGFPGLASQCSEPPFVSVSIVPNVLLVLDNSASMYDLAYVDDNAQDSYCYDDSYQSPYDSYTSVPGETYYGYYDPATWYRYNTTNSRFESTTTPSSDCTNLAESRSDYCVKLNGNQLVHAYFRGNLLNWATMSKLDVEKKVLTGGKYDGTAMVGESRGCIGRRYIKEVKCWVSQGKKYNLKSSGIVFGVRGVASGGSDAITRFFSGGQTTLEIFKASDDWDGVMDDCLYAINCFSLKFLDQFSENDDSPFGQCQNKIKSCLGYKPGGSDKWEVDSGKEHRYGFAAFVHSVHTCYRLAHPKGNRAVPNSGDIQSIKSICKGQYAHLKKDTGSTGIDTTLADPYNPSFICSRYSSGTKKVGVGWCLNDDGTAPNWGDPQNLDGDADGNTADADDCIAYQLIHFCTDASVPPQIDPSETFSFNGSYEETYIPAMIIEAGVMARLTDNGSPIASLVNKGVSETPSGLLHRAKSKVKLGLLVNNRYGSQFEFSDADRERYGCDGADSDGGTVTSPTVIDNDGIIAAINDVTANNWTPLGETFYEMTRYFRGMAPAYVSGTNHTCPVDDYCQSNNVVLISDAYPTRDHNVPGTAFGTSTVSGETSFNAETVLNRIGVDNDLNGNLPMDGTTYAVAAAYWAHTFNGKWAGGTNSNPNDKNINFFSIFALGGDPPADDRNVLKLIAKYGGFVDGNSNNLPDTGEWDGHNYVEAKDAYQLEDALTQIFYEIASVGAAGAVATVTQEMENDDLLVRGGFETDDPITSNIDWKGHLEVYIPYDGCSSFASQPECEQIAGCSWADNGCSGSMYSFQKPSNWGKFCSVSDASSGYCWDGGRGLPAHDARNIFTFINGTKTPFNQANATTLQPYLKNDIDFQNLNCASLASSTTCNNTTGCWWDSTECKPAATKLIDWVRGDTTYDGTTARNRNGWILGDVVYSTPVVVGTPSLASVDKSLIGTECTNFTACKNLTQASCGSSGYCTWDSASSSCKVNLSSPHSSKCFYTYREANLTRKKMVYSGANDGMLHAFVVGKYDSSTGRWLYKPSEDSEIGTELWAYIPSNFLSELKELARLSYGNDPGCKHRYLVDLSSQAWDVFIDHDLDGEREWRTVILGGERGGGDVYFALDVTNPDDPIVLWEYSAIRNLLQLDEAGTTHSFAYSYNDYMKIKALPTSWSMPYAGRLAISSSITFPVNTVTPLNPTTPSVSSSTTQNASDRWFAFIGGGFRVYEEESADAQPVDLTPLQKPNLFAVDIETGHNILQYVWPKIQHAYSSQWPEQTVGDYNIPYAMANTAAYDLWGVNTQGARCNTPDGAVDHVFVGDLSGLFWGLRIDPAYTFGLQIDLWETKNVAGGAYGYRGARQPITVTPVAALDGNPGSSSLNLHLYFGTGKFDEVEGPENDKNDAAVMSFYGLALPLSAGISAGTSTTINVGSSSFTSRLNRHGCATGCTGTADDWVTVAGQNCCYECLLDFITAGERVVDSALVASEMVFFTTFVPEMNSSCSAGGTAYLYAVDYLCRQLAKDPFDESGLSYSWLGAGGWTAGAMPAGQQAKLFRARVGAGMPSRPILDSSGEYLFVQTSDARIHKIKVNLPGNPLQVKGWKEES